MPSSNPRYLNSKARKEIQSWVRRQVLNGAPCALCGKPINLDLPQVYVDPKDGKQKRAPWSLEVDEIVPISAGGSPIDKNNVQPTHRVCNARKGGKKHASIKIESHKGANSREW